MFDVRLKPKKYLEEFIIQHEVADNVAFDRGRKTRREDIDFHQSVRKPAAVSFVILGCAAFFFGGSLIQLSLITPVAVFFSGIYLRLAYAHSHMAVRNYLIMGRKPRMNVRIQQEFAQNKHDVLSAVQLVPMAARHRIFEKTTILEFNDLSDYQLRKRYTIKKMLPGGTTDNADGYYRESFGHLRMQRHMSKRDAEKDNFYKTHYAENFEATMLHEFGHVYDAATNRFSRSKEFVECFKDDRKNFIDNHRIKKFQEIGYDSIEDAEKALETYTKAYKDAENRAQVLDRAMEMLKDNPDTPNKDKVSDELFSDWLIAQRDLIHALDLALKIQFVNSYASALQADNAYYLSKPGEAYAQLCSIIWRLEGKPEAEWTKIDYQDKAFLENMPKCYASLKTHMDRQDARVALSTHGRKINLVARDKSAGFVIR